MPSRPTSPATAHRRTVLRRAAALGLTAGPAASLLSACGGDDDSASAAEARRGPIVPSDDPENPFGVDPSVPLDVVIFKGGFSDEYATQGHQQIYRSKFPDAEITHLGTELISEVVRPRMLAGNPPDVLQNSGGEALPMEGLVSDGRLLDLRQLLDAPSIDDPEVPVRDTIVASAISSGALGDEDGPVWSIPYTLSAWGLWYSQRLFDDNGWTLPNDWTEFMALAEQIKTAGIAPMTFAGVFPQYTSDAFMTLAVRHGGRDVIDSINDDFGPSAWEHESLLLSAQAWEEFAGQGFMLDGSADLDHRGSQARWLAGEAAFIPVGTWLESEEAETLDGDPDFAPRFMAIPPLPDSADPNLVQASPGETFLAPKYSNNPAGGLEYLRIMLSRAGVQEWMNHTGAVTTTALGDLEVPEGSTLESLEEVLSDDANHYEALFGTLEQSFQDEYYRPALRRLMSGDVSGQDFIDGAVDEA